MEGLRLGMGCATRPVISQESGGPIMNKRLSRWLFFLGILLMLIGGGFLVYAFSRGGFPTNSTVVTSQVHHPFWAMIGSIIALFGYLLGLIAWMGAIARMAQFSRWVWFVCLIILPFLGMLCYVFFGPRTPSRRAQMQRPAPMPPPTPSYGY